MSAQPSTIPNQSDLEGRRACVRARPQRRSNKERKWPLLACRRFFLVSYASFIIICFDAFFLDVVSCSLYLFNLFSFPPFTHTGRVYTMVWTLSLGFWHAHVPVVESPRLRISVRMLIFANISHESSLNFWNG